MLFKHYVKLHELRNNLRSQKNFLHSVTKASILVFPLAILLSFLFKQSRSLNSYVWPSRPPTGIVVPMEIEIPIHGDSGVLRKGLISLFK